MAELGNGFGDLHGRVALVTGAGRGIGAGVAAVLADAGADVAVNAYTPDHVVPLCAELAERTGRRVVPIVADATSPAGAAELMAQVLEQFGSLDILVNGVGDSIGGAFADVTGVDGTAVDGTGSDVTGAGAALSDAELDRVLALNLTGILHVCRAAAPALARSGHGVVLTLAGAVAHRGGAGMVAYTAAKTALVGLTRALALEWAPLGIRVNAIAPGIVPDPNRPQFDAAAGARFAAQVPLGALGTPEQVGQVARFLVSDAADYVTGQTLYVDGGYTL